MNQLDPSALSQIASFLTVDDIDAFKFINRKNVAVFGSGIKSQSLVNRDFSYLFDEHHENSDLEREWSIFEDRNIPSILIQLNFLEDDFPIPHVLRFFRHLVGEKNFKQWSSTEADIIINWGSEGRSSMDLIFKEIDALSSINLKGMEAENQEQTVREMISNWRENKRFFISENDVLNPFRVFKKIKIKIQGFQDKFSNLYEEHPRPIRCKNCIHVTSSHPKTFFNEYDVIMFNGSIKHDYKTCKTFDNLPRDKFEKFDEKCRLILYSIVRFKLIPLMEEFSIDLKTIVDKNTIHSITKFIEKKDLSDAEKQHKLFLFFTTQYNILEAYRNRYLKGDISPQIFVDKEMQDLEVVLECCYFDLIRLNFESMNDLQRQMFFETFTKSFLKSQLMISDELLEEYGKATNQKIENRFKLEKKKENVKLVFQTLEFQRVIGIVRNNILQFPNKKTSSCFKSIELSRPQNQKMIFDTKTGTLNKCISKFCCSHWLTSLCSLTTVLTSWCCTYPCCNDPKRFSKSINMIE
ncbi:predicted protein [Naegleria gruberi]|uniref:Predicted protein n=1 Tax=Naegleria gruberi TaxID=5762 RepID=D2W374_NAEGR|nr:uncharacterized protein NAEGRDRAFT_54359 [Naegleria gruberi]EFC36439.1 predicted protein [Naegleria gruberi]|eukprot:XP_002669183.1 predicted protein [Naegleria gruberi strain NEG-M]